MKRVFDLVIVALSVPFVAPVFLLLALLVRLNLGRPIFFRQCRPGLKGRPFEMVKFRTMCIATDKQGRMLPDGERLSRFGRWLRSTSLDELPELLNVLKGEMSLVGPRPLLLEYLPRYSAEQLHRQDVLPGITGWAQINGRNSCSWEEKFILDVWYVDHCSTALDLRILFLTLLQVVRRDGIHAAGTASMPVFLGSGKARITKDGGSTMEQVGCPQSRCGSTPPGGEESSV